MGTSPGWLTSRRGWMFCIRPDIPLTRFGPISAPKPHFRPGARGRERVQTARWRSAHTAMHDLHAESQLSDSATVVSAKYDLPPLRRLCIPSAGAPNYSKKNVLMGDNANYTN